MEALKDNIESTGVTKTVSDISQQQWDLALHRYSIIAPLIHHEPDVSITAIANQSGVNRTTIFRWVEKYKATQSVSSLVDVKRTGGQGISRIPEDIEAIIQRVIHDRYLNKQKLTAKRIALEVAIECRKEGIKIPHYNTIRKRIGQISEQEKLSKRYHSSLVRDQYVPLRGTFPEADYPLAAVQIHHTPLDIIVIDPKNASIMMPKEKPALR